MKIFSLLWYLIRELIFTDKNEYNPASNRFNGKKVALATLVMISLALNVMLMDRYYKAIVRNVELNNQCTMPQVENHPKVPSDRSITVKKETHG